jgi:hypothetical protein
MNEPAGIISPETVRRLLEGDPSVRFFALSGLLGAAPDDPEVVAARRAVVCEGPVPRILATQGADGAELLLRHHAHERSHDLARDSAPGRRRFGFPFMHQTDALEVLEILTKLGCRDERMHEAHGTGADAHA